MTLLPMGTAPLRKLRIERLRWGAAVLLAMALTYLVVLSTRHAQVYVLESMSVGAENKVSLTANDTKLQVRPARIFSMRFCLVILSPDLYSLCVYVMAPAGAEISAFVLYSG